MSCFTGGVSGGVVLSCFTGGVSGGVVLLVE